MGISIGRCAECADSFYSIDAAQLCDHCTDKTAQLQTLRTRNAELEKELARVRGLMLKIEEYSAHVIGCDLRKGTTDTACTCGLWELQAKVYAEEEAQEQAQERAREGGE